MLVLKDIWVFMDKVIIILFHLPQKHFLVNVSIPLCLVPIALYLFDQMFYNIFI